MRNNTISLDIDSQSESNDAAGKSVGTKDLAVRGFERLLTMPDIQGTIQRVVYVILKTDCVTSSSYSYCIFVYWHYTILGKLYTNKLRYIVCRGCVHRESYSSTYGIKLSLIPTASTWQRMGETRTNEK